jgi:hypothetical protein
MSLPISIKAIRLLDYSEAFPSVIAQFDAVVGPFLLQGGTLKVNQRGTVIAWPPVVRSRDDRENGIHIADFELRRELARVVRQAYRLMGGTRDGNGPTFGDEPEPTHPAWVAKATRPPGVQKSTAP